MLTAGSYMVENSPVKNEAVPGGKPRMNRKLIFLLMMALGAVLVIAACGGDDPTPTPTPALPTATATPTPGSGALLSPLGDNLVEVWSYNRQGRSWQYFSTNPEFAGQNDISTLVTDQLYWLRAKEDQSVKLNGRQRNVAAGWTLIHW